jgi:hypothetical protein
MSLCECTDAKKSKEQMLSVKFKLFGIHTNTHIEIQSAMTIIITDFLRCPPRKLQCLHPRS